MHTFRFGQTMIDPSIHHLADEYINMPMYNLDDGIVFDDHGRILRERDVLAVVDARDRRQVHARDAALPNKRNADGEEDPGVVSANRKLERAGRLLRVD